MLTTQYLEEADRLTDEIVVIDHGHVIAQGAPSELKARTGATQLALTVRDADNLERARTALEFHLHHPAAQLSARTLTFAVSGDPLDTLARATDALRADAIAVEDLALRQPTLDEAFLALTGQHIQSADRPNAQAAAAQEVTNEHRS